MAVNPKQQVSINNIVSGITTRLGENAPKFETVEEAPNVFLMSESYPTIKLGRDGGVEVPELRSYPDGLEAAINADVLLAKQKDRDAKKAEAAAKSASEAPAPITRNDAAFQTGQDAADQSEVINADQGTGEEVSA